jgi:hypothetical protein
MYIKETDTRAFSISRQIQMLGKYECLQEFGWEAWILIPEATKANKKSPNPVYAATAL